MAGKYRLTYFQNRQQPRVARPGDPPTRARASDGAHVKTVMSTNAQERKLDSADSPANPTFAGYAAGS